MENLIWSSYYPYEEGAVVIPNLHVRQLRHRDGVARPALFTTMLPCIG